MKKGDIVFIKGNSLISKAITKLDKMSNGDDGKYSHVAIAVSNKHILQAEYSSKVSVVRLDTLINEGKVNDYEVVDLKLDTLQREYLYRASMTHVGKSYDYLLIFSFLLNKLLGFKLINNKNRFICSELVISSMNKADLLKGYDTDKLIDMTPNELYEFINEYNR